MAYCKIIDNFLPLNEYKTIQKKMDKVKFNEDKDYWLPELTEDNDVKLNSAKFYRAGGERVLSDKITKLIFDITRMNIVSHTQMAYEFGYMGGILLHKDSYGVYNDERSKFWEKERHVKKYACTYYLNDNWNPNWGGETIIYDWKQKYPSWNKKYPSHPFSECNEKLSVRPKGNRLLVMENVWHRVMPNTSKNVKRRSIQSFVKVSHRPYDTSNEEYENQKGY
tara:strand:+ start:1193 stop:1861 length:669 start_codon:yes stop_codon:yes gene_type:complete